MRGLGGVRFATVYQHSQAFTQQPTVEKGHRLQGFYLFTRSLKKYAGCRRSLFGDKHGEVPNPHHHAGERPSAHDQPLLSGCKGSGAEFGASNAGKGPWCAAPLPGTHGAAGPAAGITFTHDFTVLCSARLSYR